MGRVARVILVLGGALALPGCYDDNCHDGPGSAHGTATLPLDPGDIFSTHDECVETMRAAFLRGAGGRASSRPACFAGPEAEPAAAPPETEIQVECEMSGPGEWPRPVSIGGTEFKAECNWFCEVRFPATGEVGHGGCLYRHLTEAEIPGGC